MIKDQCISITDLRVKTKKCLEGLNKGEKYVFINNKPTAVLISIEDFENYFKRPMLFELAEKEVSQETIEKIKMSKKRRKSELLNI